MVKRIRPMRMVTIDPKLVKRLKAVGKTHNEGTNLSRLLDTAMSEYIERRSGKNGNGTKPNPEIKLRK